MSDPMAGQLSARASARYALDVYLPFTAIERAWRARMRSLRGTARRHTQVTRLPQSAWSEIFARRPIHLVETEKRNGNYTIRNDPCDNCRCIYFVHKTRSGGALAGICTIVSDSIWPC